LYLSFIFIFYTIFVYIIGTVIEIFIKTSNIFQYNRIQMTFRDYVGAMLTIL